MNFAPFLKYSSVFVETGTCRGDGLAAALAAGFTTIKSVEASKDYYIFANNRFRNNKEVTIYYGKSFDRLPEMIAGIPCPSVFFLDAHPAGPNTAGHDELMNGDKEWDQHNILIKELDIITSDGPHVILIDDMNNWHNTREYTNLLDEVYPDTYTYQLIDDVRPDITYKEKVLVCLPVL